MGETAGGAKAGAEALEHHVRPADKNQINCAPFECWTMATQLPVIKGR